MTIDTSTRPALFLDAIRGQTTYTAPIWLMRQAGRYLPEYRAIKEKHRFWDMVRTPDLAADVTLQPVQRFPLDAAILFSDIMTPLPAMGVSIEFSPGPTIANPIRSRADVTRLRVPDSAEIAPFVAETIRAVRSAITVPLIGFAGAPLTLAAYLVDGAGGDHHGFRAWLRAEPAAAAELIEKLTDVTIGYLRMQIDAGAQAIQLFDSWAGIHDAETYQRYGIPGLKRIFDAITDASVPRIYLAVGASHLYPQIAALPVDAVSIDWRTDLGSARRLFGDRPLQGNLDPAVLLAPPSVVVAAAHRTLTAGLGGSHVFNLGHGLLPGTPVDNVALLVDTVHAFDRTTSMSHR